MVSTTGSRGRRAAPRQGETSAEAVARHVRKQIFDGRLAAGQRLPQDEIALAVGVSRIPVREAIISLEREGWLRVENHRGAFVHALDEQAVTDRFELYGRFYGFAVRRAIDHLTASDLESLAGLAERVAGAGSAASMERASGQYLAELLGLAASNRLVSVLRSTSHIVPGNYFATVDGSIEIQRTGIAELQAAIVARDRDRGEQASISMQREHAAAVLAMMAARRP